MGFLNGISAQTDAGEALAQGAAQPRTGMALAGWVCEGWGMPFRSLALMIMLAAGPAQGQQPLAQQPVDCLASGLLFLLGAGSQQESGMVSYSASLSNPGMRNVWLRAGFAGTQPGEPLRIEAGRTIRLRLGEGEALLSAEQIISQARLLCQRG